MEVTSISLSLCNSLASYQFLIEKNNSVVPIEVKAGNTSTVSLNNFINDYNPAIAYKFISGNMGKVERKLTLPHYMIMFI